MMLPVKKRQEMRINLNKFRDRYCTELKTKTANELKAILDTTNKKSIFYQFLNDCHIEKTNQEQSPTRDPNWSSIFADYNDDSYLEQKYQQLEFKIPCSVRIAPKNSKNSTKRQEPPLKGFVVPPVRSDHYDR